MGAWGHRAFDNDEAGDWGSEMEMRGWEAVSSAVRAVSALPDDEYLELTEASWAIAAAEVVAAAEDGDTSNLPEEVRAALAELGRMPDGSMIAEAQKAVARVLEQSELKELWQESDYYDQWREDVEALAARLR
jgi:hypothetical protein